MTTTEKFDGSMTSSPDYLTPDDLAGRYRIPKATAAKWRWNGSGPPFIKLGAKVLYRTVDVDAWIAERIRTCTVANDNNLG